MELGSTVDLKTIARSEESLKEVARIRECIDQCLKYGGITAHLGSDTNWVVIHLFFAQGPYLCQ